MSVSAREKVFGIRYAQSQVKKLRKEMLDGFSLENHENESTQKRNYSKRISNADIETRIRSKLISSEEKALMAKLEIDGNANMMRHIFSSKSVLRSGEETSSISSSVSRKSSLVEFPMHLLEELVPLPPIQKTSKNYNKFKNLGPGKGLIFRHRYKFQESSETTPAVSRPSSIYPSAKSSKSILVCKGPEDEESTTGSQTSKRVMWADEVNAQSLITAAVSLDNASPSPFNNPPSLPFPMNKGTENLCLSSLVNLRKGPTSWINRRFPEIAQDLKRGENSREETEADEVIYPSRRSYHPPYAKTREPLPELAKDQPLPHKRGLTGVEISSFEPQCAYFFRNSKGILNPHLKAISAKRSRF